MKNTLHLLSIIFSITCYAQPTFIGALSNDGPLNGGSLFKLQRPANTASIIYPFNNMAPHRPESAVTTGDDNWLYGTLRYNGVNNNGALYRIKKDGTGFNILYTMSHSLGPTTRPYFHTDGKIYFTDEASIILFDPSTNNFNQLLPDQWVYVRNLLIDSDDWIYFTTETGTLSKMKTDGSQFTILRNFFVTGDGSDAQAGVTEGPGDTLYGILQNGGSLTGGLIFSIKKDGTGFAVLHEFDPTLGNFDGFYPESKLVLYDGKLFGTTSRGGAEAYGIVYSINLDGSNYHVVSSIPGGTGGPGSEPVGDISINSDPSVIGAFSQFSYSNNGPQRFFRVDTSGITFEKFGYVDQHESGQANNSPLLLDDGTMLFTTQTMGRHDGGALSQVLTGGAIVSLYNFGASANGFKPGEVIKGSDGKLYGVATIGGATGNGVIYSVLDDGTGYTKLCELNDAIGYNISGKLLEASDGKLYGACSNGGPTGAGCLFRLDKTGSNLQVIYNFPILANGYSPTGSLIEDAGGTLYGTTVYAFPGQGVVFKINKDGSGYTPLKVFNSSDPGYLYGGLKLSGGYLYGSGYNGGALGFGGVFRMHTDGTGYELLHSFNQSTEGGFSFAAPTIGSGKLYGTTTYGGTSSTGTLYSMDIGGTNFTVLRNLSSGDAQYPAYGLILSSDGALYGTGFTGSGNAIFRMNTNGSNYSILKTFDVTTEGQVVTSLIETSNVSLPVTLTKFQVQKRNESALLTWETAQEANSNSFNIERSAEGNTFNQIGTVNARGNSNAVTSYSFNDDAPIKGMNYYRLKQVDNDGKFEYSPVRTIMMNKESTITVYPNPAVNNIEISLPAQVGQSTIEVSNSEGKIAKRINASNARLVHLSVIDLPAGAYVIKVISNNKVETVPFVKQNR